MDWWSPVISVCAGLSGVVVGSWLTTRREREDRRLRFIRQQLEEFYAPFCALRQEIRAKSELRVKLTGAAASEWVGLFKGITGPEAVYEIDRENRDRFDSLIAYNNKQLTQEFIPSYQKMLGLFRDKLWLVEESTRTHYPKLVDFVETWNRFLGESLPVEVVRTLGHDEETVRPLYEDAERHRDLLQRQLKRGGSVE